MAVTQRPVTAAALEEAAGEPAWRSVPSWPVIATEDLTIPPEARSHMPERAEARTVEVRASHAVGVSRPHDVARIVLEAARAAG